jgi:hypothetical protein
MKHLIWLGLSAFVLLGCEVSPLDPHESVPQPKSEAAGWDAFGYLGAGPELTHEERFAEVARLAPGFGGFFQDLEDRRFYAYVLDPDEAEATRSALESRIGNGQAAFPEVLFLAGTFDYRDLMSWRRKLHNEAASSLVWSSVRDSENRIRIGVPDETTRRRVLDLLPDLGIPTEAVGIIVTDYPEVSLQAVRRPVIGGTKILARPNPANWCTLTGVAVRELPSGQFDLFPPRYVMTNSHCTPTFGSVASTPTKISQPLPPDSIGTEFSDPPLVGTHPDCPPNKVCRFSDAAIFQLYGGPGGGHIPVHWNAAATASGITFTGSQEYSGLQLQWWAGQNVTKMGASTGQTSGVIVDACRRLDFPHSGAHDPGRSMLCQATATYHSAMGDSGAPVWYTAMDGGRRLLGIHSARITNENVSVFSLMLYARSELANDIWQRHGQAWTPSLTSGPHFYGP